MNGSCCKKGGERTGASSRGTADRKAWNEKTSPAPKNSSWTPLSQIPYPFIRKSCWLCLQSISKVFFPHNPPGAANGWGWARSTERIEKKFIPPERWGHDPVDPASLPRSLEQARLPEGGGGVTRQEREGRVFLAEGTAWLKMRRNRELQCGCSGLRNGKRCKLRQERLAGASPCRVKHQPEEP